MSLRLGPDRIQARFVFNARIAPILWSLTVTSLDCVLKTEKYRILKGEDRLYLQLSDDETSNFSEMILSEPERLLSEYTRKMLQPLVFIPRPADVILVGLGGGQQAKFVHRYLPELRMIALEIDPEVVDLARSHFGVPPDDERLSVVVADAADFIQNHSGRCDMILLDAFGEGNVMIETLHTAEFYQACHRILRPGGLIAVNVYRPTAMWADSYMSMLSTVFTHKRFFTVSPDQGIMVLWKGVPDFTWERIDERAAQLDERTDLNFQAFVDSFKNSLAMVR